MPNLNYDTIARILSKSEPQTWRITDNGGMVVVSADGHRLSFTPAEVNEADLPRVYPDLPVIKPAPVPDVIVAPKPQTTSHKPRASKSNVFEISYPPAKKPKAKTK